MIGTILNRLRALLLLPCIGLLGACHAVVMDPSGDIAVQQRDMLLVSTYLMLLIIVPVILLTVWFAWKYRQSNKEARYEPDWDHSTQLELVIWSVPLLIIICLGAITWVGTHLLDPFRPLDRIAPGRPIAKEINPLEVDVVALDWKWLFIYPEYGVATVNELAAPLDRPIDFHITSASVMNSFYIPALAGQIYAMVGMDTQLHAVINKPGKFSGMSANYSGAGFSGMHFTFYGRSEAEFAQWIAAIKQDKARLGRSDYLTLAQPTSNEPVRHYGSIDTSLYGAVLNMCVEPGKTCMNQMNGGSATEIDSKGDAKSPAEHDEYKNNAMPPMPGMP